MDVPAESRQENAQEAKTSMVKVPEFLLKRNQARLDDVERRKETKASSAVTEENSSVFSSTFNRELAAIEALLPGCSGEDRAAANQTLQEVTAKTKQLQKFLNDSLVFLTQYELRKGQASLQKLQASIAEKRDQALPKKKFTFRARKATEEVAARVPSPVPAAAPVPPAGSGSAKAGGAVTSEQCGFSNMDSVVLTKGADEIRRQDVLLTHLTNCKVRLMGAPSTLHIKHISGCEVLCGPVSSSVFVDHCRNSTLAFPCQQLRTHNTTDTQVYLHVTSRAIIEDCHGVSLAPFSWSYPTLEEDFRGSGLDQDRNNWTQVDDFNWLAAGTPSPNWTVIPVEERKTSWDL